MDNILGPDSLDHIVPTIEETEKEIESAKCSVSILQVAEMFLK